MKLILNNGVWINPGDEVSGKPCRIFIENGQVVSITDRPQHFEHETEIDVSGHFISPGWIDLKVNAFPPAFHLHESPDTLAKAAAAGGFTQIQLQPTPEVLLQTPELVHYFSHLEHANGVRFRVAASATLDLEGKKMTDMQTLAWFGADSFSTVEPVANAGFFSQLLKYSTHTGKVVMHPAMDPNLAAFGQTHEGHVAERRGLVGVPSVAEAVMVQRDLALQAYTGARLHLTGFSSKFAANLIRQARKAGSEITCDVPAHQLACTDEDLDQFNTSYKVWPPFRAEEDQAALVEAVLDGTITAITSDHKPFHYDYKDIEFGNASFGIAGLETAFALLNMYAKGISADRIVDLLHAAPARILNIEPYKLAVGAPANFTIFSTQTEWSPSPEAWQSRSANNPFINKPLTGSVLGVVTQTGFHPNPHLV